MRRAVTAALSAFTLAVPVANGVAATRDATSTTTVKKKVVTRKVVGTAVQADRWGTVQVTLVVRKTTVTSGAKSRVTRRIVGVTATYRTTPTARCSSTSRRSLTCARRC
jgi:hypothetical protein